MAKKNKGIRPGTTRINEDTSFYSVEPRNIPEPQLLWPHIDFDTKEPKYNRNDKILFRESEEFVGFEMYRDSIDRVLKWETMKNKSLLRLKSIFYTEILSCKNVYIVDNFFSIEEFIRLMDVVIDAKGCPLRYLHIICDSYYDDIIKEVKTLEKTRQVANMDIRIASLKRAGKRYFDIHDRFALLDHEIWHFGWTVCGIGHNLNAYSRGWIDKGGKFKDYLDKIVRKS